MVLKNRVETPSKYLFSQNYIPLNSKLRQKENFIAFLECENGF